MFAGNFDLPWRVPLGGLTHVGSAAFTLCLRCHRAHRAHRAHCAHCALDPAPRIAHLFRCWLGRMTGTITKAWIAIRRQHPAGHENARRRHRPPVRGLPHVSLERLTHAPLRKPGVVNRVGYFRAHRNHDSADVSTGIVAWDALVGSEELHSNRRSFAVPARLSRKNHALDPGGRPIVVVVA